MDEIEELIEFRIDYTFKRYQIHTESEIETEDLSCENSESEK